MAEDCCAKVDALGKRVAAVLSVTSGLPEWFLTKDVPAFALSSSSYAMASLERRPTEGAVHGEIAPDVPILRFLLLPRPALFVGLGLTNADAIDPGPSLIK
jgi:hypothetical protein